MNYNNCFGYSGYPYFSTPPQAFTPAPQTNVLPPQQVLKVNGKASIDTLQMSPNSSVLAMDETAPIVWLCVSDGIGKVTATPYDVSQHHDVPPVDVNGLEQRVSNIEQLLQKMTEVQSDEPDAATADGSKTAGKSNAWTGAKR